MDFFLLNKHPENFFCFFTFFIVKMRISIQNIFSKGAIDSARISKWRPRCRRDISTYQKER